MDESVRTKYPIILVHGIALKDWRLFRSFGRIRKVLSAAGYSVYAAKTDAFGSIENNAEQLKAQIQDILQKESVDKVNLIAHSKGGLDSLYMVHNLDMASSVASITTLSTPHKGSSMASKIYSLPRLLLRFIAFWINLWYRIFGDKHPDSLTVCRQLCLTDEKSENMTVPDGVYCQSYSSTMKHSRDDFLMSIPFFFSRRWGASSSDGLVTADSAKYAEYRGDCIDDSISHLEIIGISIKRKKRRKIYAFYLSLCRELAELGY